MDYILKSIDYYSPDHKGLYNGIAQLTNSINDTYPDLNDWLQKKFFPGLKDGIIMNTHICFGSFIYALAEVLRY